MTVRKTLAVGVLTWGTLASGVHAAAIDSNSNRGWLRWFVPTSTPTPTPQPAPAPPSSLPPQSSQPAPIFAPKVMTATPVATLPAPVSQPVANPLFATINAPSAPSAPPSSPAPTPPPAPPAPPSSAPAYPVDAVINMSDGPFPGQATLASPSAQPWYLSPVAVKVFNGVPDSAQRAQFSSDVLNRVEQIYTTNSHIPLTVTTDTTTPTAHQISLVANSSNADNPQAVGLTEVGYNGFTFLDKFGAATDEKTLAAVVGANIAHEMMHSFGGAHHDTTGNFVDAGVGNWDAMISSGLQFSDAAIQDLSSKNFRAVGQGVYNRDGQVIAAQPVPEPATLLAWGLVIAAGVAYARSARRRAPAL